MKSLASLKFKKYDRDAAMKATAIMKSGLAGSPAYSDAVFEIDITVSIMANANRGETLPFLSMVIVEVGNDAMCYDAPEGIGQDWEIVSAPVMYDSPTSLDCEELAVPRAIRARARNVQRKKDKFFDKMIIFVEQQT